MVLPGLLQFLLIVAALAFMSASTLFIRGKEAKNTDKQTPSQPQTMKHTSIK